MPVMPRCKRGWRRMMPRSTLLSAILKPERYLPMKSQSYTMTYFKR